MMLITEFCSEGRLLKYLQLGRSWIKEVRREFTPVGGRCTPCAVNPPLAGDTRRGPSPVSSASLRAAPKSAMRGVTGNGRMEPPNSLTRSTVCDTHEHFTNRQAEPFVASGATRNLGVEPLLARQGSKGSLPSAPVLPGG